VWRQAHAAELRKRPDFRAADGGQDGIFLALADKCFDWNSGQYRYSVCPFKSVSQQEGATKVSLAGGKPSEARWEPADGGGRKLVMYGGTHCPPIKDNRATEITFACALVDRLRAVEEFETCRYTAILETPLACTDPDFTRGR
jgi:protein kinase C substrate 80K-H